jgi:pyruvate,water dikinase
MSTSTVDMSRPQWRENPQLIVEMIKNCQLFQEREDGIDEQSAKPLSGMMLRRFYNNFAEYEQYSLRIGFIYSYGYSLFRRYFLHIGDLLAAKGYIPSGSDVFYLTSDEIKELSTSSRLTFDCDSLIEKMKREIQEYSDIELPTVIYGDTSPPPVRKGSIAKRLKGLPTSRGYYEGKARVITTTEEFIKIQKGDVLVIPYSDASWTPLFSKAGAVVSESGGLLSHCSIVAREYGIPAVVAVDGVTKIEDDTLLLVDGFTGNVLITE